MSNDPELTPDFHHAADIEADTPIAAGDTKSLLLKLAKAERAAQALRVENEALRLRMSHTIGSDAASADRLTTEDYRNAVNGTGPEAGQWADKPHRLVYDLCDEVERLRAANKRMLMALRCQQTYQDACDEVIHCVECIRILTAAGWSKDSGERHWRREEGALDIDCQSKFSAIIESVRGRARELGYTIAVHGSLKRDIDLIAVPWTFEAVKADELVESLRIVSGGQYAWNIADGHENTLAGCYGRRDPHGHLGWWINLGDGVFVDLTVTPRIQNTN